MCRKDHAAIHRTVSNSTNTAVTWQVNGTAGGNSSAAPSTATESNSRPLFPASSVTITAVLQADTCVSSNSIVTITAVVFDNSSLKGNYIFSLSGIDLNGFAFYAVGRGHRRRRRQHHRR